VAGDSFWWVKSSFRLFFIRLANFQKKIVAITMREELQLLPPKNAYHSASWAHCLAFIRHNPSATMRHFGHLWCSEARWYRGSNLPLSLTPWYIIEVVIAGLGSFIIDTLQESDTHGHRGKIFSELDINLLFLHIQMTNSFDLYLYLLKMFLYLMVFAF